MCVYNPFRCRCALHVRTISFLVKNLFLINKKIEKKIFLKISVKKCAGAKNGVWVRAPHITLCDVPQGVDQNCRTKGLKNKNASSESSSPHCVCYSDFFKTSFCTANTAILSVHPYCKPTQNKEGKFMVKNMRRLQFCPILFAYLTLVKCIAQDQQSSK